MSSDSARVVVMIAMEEEAQFFKPYLEGMHEIEHIEGLVKIYRGELEGITVDVCISGIGAVHAASAITAILLKYPLPIAVLSCGCSGAHHPDQRKGDIIIGSSVTPLSALVVERQGKTRPCGIRYSMLDAPTMSFEADQTLLRIGVAAAHAISDEAAEGTRRPRVDVGVVGSSDVWRQSPTVIADCVTLTHSLCEEMEAHSLAQVCRTFKVPFLAIKDVANSEIHPEAIQLDPTHSLVPESSPVGIIAAKVTARALSLMAHDAEVASKFVATAAGTASATASRTRKRRQAADEAELPPSQTARA